MPIRVAEKRRQQILAQQLHRRVLRIRGRGRDDDDRVGGGNDRNNLSAVCSSAVRA
jgi:hypothetical protein